MTETQGLLVLMLLGLCAGALLNISNHASAIANALTALAGVTR